MFLLVFRLTLYSCWPSDQIVWAFVIPALLIATVIHFPFLFPVHNFVTRPQPRFQVLSSSRQKHQKRDPLFSDAFGGKKRDTGNEVGELNRREFVYDAGYIIRRTEIDEINVDVCQSTEPSTVRMTK